MNESQFEGVFLDIKDIVLTPIYFIILLLIGYESQKKNLSLDERRKFVFFLAFKLSLSTAFGLIYFLIYDGGDTFLYFLSGKMMNRFLFQEGPYVYLKLLLSHGEFDETTYHVASQFYWYGDTASFTIVKITALLGLLTFNTYIPIAMFFSLFSFLGLWKLYKTFILIYPSKKELLGVLFFIFPNMAFWSSGILKDSIVLGLVCLLFHFTHKLFYESKLNFVLILKQLIICYFIFEIKSYVLACFMPAFLFLVLKSIYTSNISIVMKMFLSAVILPTSITVMYLILNSDSFSEQINFFSKRVMITSNYLYRISEIQEGSSYSLGEVDGTFQSIVSKTHLAVFTTLFRPFVWESKNVTMFLTAFENSVVIAMIFYSLIMRNPLKTFKLLINDRNVIFSLILILFLGTLVGISSYNFGTLVRYKIPITPFFYTVIALLFPTKSQKEYIKH